MPEPDDQHITCAECDALLIGHVGVVEHAPMHGGKFRISSVYPNPHRPHPTALTILRDIMKGS